MPNYQHIIDGWKCALPPDDENARLKALHELDVLDTPAEEAFDNITRLVSSTLKTPVAVISLVDENRQWFKSCFGANLRETSREVAFCAHVIHSDDLFVVEDTREDERFYNNPLVTDSPHIRFYAAAPLKSPQGYRIGTLCTFDSQPRPQGLNEEEAFFLRSMAGIVSDKLHLRMTLAQLQKSKESYKLAAQGSSAALFEWDIESDQITWRGRSCENFAAAINSHLPQSSRLFENRIHADDRPHVRNALSRYFCRDDEDFCVNMRVLRDDGEWIWLLFRGAAHWNQDGRATRFYGSMTDITDSKKAEIELQRAKEMADRANQQKSEFLANMSHELRTPLNSIIGFSNLLLKNKDGQFSPKDLNFLERITSNGLHLLELINDVLDLSKIEAGQLTIHREQVDLRELAQGLLRQLESQTMKKGLQLRVDMPSEMAPVETDPQKLKQILINLMGNAIKFTEAGTVTLRVQANAVTRQPEMIEIVDTGVGIAEKDLQMIFNAFKQTEKRLSRSEQGTGLGLSISQSLCELLGYRISVESQLDRGSTFRISLNPAIHQQPVIERATG